MKFAKWTFLLSGIYGLLVLTPMLFLEERMSLDYPPAITHPENYYGFIIAAIAWQIAFLVISRDPARYRSLMLVAAFVEKFGYGLTVIALYMQQRVAVPVMVLAGVDMLLGVLFIIAYVKTGNAPRTVGAVSLAH